MFSSKRISKIASFAVLWACLLAAGCSEEPKNPEDDIPAKTTSTADTSAIESNTLADTAGATHKDSISAPASARQKNQATSLQGYWTVNEIIYLYNNDSSASGAALLPYKNNHLSITDSQLDFVFQGHLGEINVHCALDSIRKIARRSYGPKDINSHFKGTSYWYGYRRDRGDSIISFALFCPDSQFNFEYFSEDTLGFFDSQRLFLFTRQH